MNDADTVRPLNGQQILARLTPSDGVGSGLDADLVRGRQPLAATPRMYTKPMFGPRRTYSTIVAAYIAR